MSRKSAASRRRRSERWGRLGASIRTRRRGRRRSLLGAFTGMFQLDAGLACRLARRDRQVVDAARGVSRSAIRGRLSLCNDMIKARGGLTGGVLGVGGDAMALRPVARRQRCAEQAGRQEGRSGSPPTAIARRWNRRSHDGARYRGRHLTSAPDRTREPLTATHGSGSDATTSFNRTGAPECAPVRTDVCEPMWKPSWNRTKVHCRQSDEV